jgi:hypothetical protein
VAVRPIKPLVHASLPGGWEFKESLTLLAPDGRANLIVSSEPLEHPQDSQEYADAQGDLLRMEFPGYQEFTIEPFELADGARGLLRRFEWAPPDGEVVTQLQLYYAEGGRGFTVTATSPTTDFARFEKDFQDVLTRLQFG